MKATFYGGSKIVTGSNYLLEHENLKFVVDCGLFQGSRFNEDLNYEAFPYDPAAIDFVFITHSHMDHIGRLPKLYREGFRGTVYATEPTKDIMEVAFDDAYEKIADEAAEAGRPPLYTKEDVAGVMSHVKGVRYEDELNIGSGVTVKLHDAGHILGSSIIEIIWHVDGDEKKVVFSGDLGNPPVPLLNVTEFIPRTDYLIMESAYGNRIHKDKDNSRERLREVIKQSVARKGVLMIPSFAVERTQELLFIIDDLLLKGEIPQIPIFLDSPLAIRMTKVYEKFYQYFNPEAVQVLTERKGLFAFDWLTITLKPADSKRINEVPAPKIIIAGSGMSIGGRILHHELRYLPGPENTILFVGYQVAGSLGRRILEGEKKVKIFGQEVEVNCVRENIGGFSAHADQNGLMKFVRESNEGKELKKVFLVQGEDQSAQALAEKIIGELKIDTTVPNSGDSFVFE